MMILPMESSFPAFWERESFLGESFSHRKETRESRKLSSFFPEAFFLLSSRARVGGKKAFLPVSSLISPFGGKSASGKACALPWAAESCRPEGSKHRVIPRVRKRNERTEK
jgi:hypothetical protein